MNYPITRKDVRRQCRLEITRLLLIQTILLFKQFNKAYLGLSVEIHLLHCQCRSSPAQSWSDHIFRCWLTKSHLQAGIKCCHWAPSSQSRTHPSGHQSRQNHLDVIHRSQMNYNFVLMQMLAYSNTNILMFNTEAINTAMELLNDSLV